MNSIPITINKFKVQIDLKYFFSLYWTWMATIHEKYKLGTVMFKFSVYKSGHWNCLFWSWTLFTLVGSAKSSLWYLSWPVCNSSKIAFIFATNKVGKLLDVKIIIMVNTRGKLLIAVEIYYEEKVVISTSLQPTACSKFLCILSLKKTELERHGTESWLYTNHLVLKMLISQPLRYKLTR